MVDRAVTAGQADRGELRRKSEEYLALTQSMVLTLADLFDTIDENPSAWAGDIQRYLPGWVVA
jgi:hypothetical protein